MHTDHFCLTMNLLLLAVCWVVGGASLKMDSNVHKWCFGWHLPFVTPLHSTGFAQQLRICNFVGYFLLKLGYSLSGWGWICAVLQVKWSQLIFSGREYHWILTGGAFLRINDGIINFCRDEVCTHCACQMHHSWGYARSIHPHFPVEVQFPSGQAMLLSPPKQQIPY